MRISIKFIIFKMLDSVSNTPLIGHKGENLNLIQINFDHSDSSTGESNPSGEVSKYENIIEDKNKPKKVVKQNKKNSMIIKNDTILNKKTKRGKSSTNNKKIKDNKKNKNTKYKLILNIFNEFKSSSPLYKEFSQFHAIEKNIKNELYSSSSELAGEMRNIFSHIFLLFFNDPVKYNKTLILCELFEKIYKKYDNKILTKECKNLVEMINKLKKELRQTELSKNNSNENISYSNNNCVISPYSSSKNKFKFQFNDSDSEISVKKYKNEITNKIKKLSIEQKKGLFNVVSNECIDKNTQNNVMEINVNKMTLNQLKQLEKYVNQCIKDNNSGVSSPIEKKSEMSRSKFIEDEKESEILRNDDLSSCLSDDDEDEDDE